jgi:hypothetical protein
LNTSALNETRCFKWETSHSGVVRQEGGIANQIKLYACDASFLDCAFRFWDRFDFRHGMK